MIKKYAGWMAICDYCKHEQKSVNIISEKEQSIADIMVRNFGWFEEGKLLFCSGKCLAEYFSDLLEKVTK